MAGSTAGDRAWQPALGFPTSLPRSFVQVERRGVRAVYDRIILRVWERLHSPTVAVARHSYVHRPIVMAEHLSICCFRRLTYGDVVPFCRLATELAESGRRVSVRKIAALTAGRVGEPYPSFLSLSYDLQFLMCCVPVALKARRSEVGNVSRRAFASPHSWGQAHANAIEDLRQLQHGAMTICYRRPSVAKARACLGTLNNCVRAGCK